MDEASQSDKIIQVLAYLKLDNGKANGIFSMLCGCTAETVAVCAKYTAG